MFSLFSKPKVEKDEWVALIDNDDSYRVVRKSSIVQVMLFNGNIFVQLVNGVEFCVKTTKELSCDAQRLSYVMSLIK